MSSFKKIAGKVGNFTGKTTGSAFSFGGDKATKGGQCAG